jgi:hypothetical protein
MDPAGFWVTTSRPHLRRIRDKAISLLSCEKTRSDDRPTNHDDLLGLDVGRGVKAG